MDKVVAAILIVASVLAIVLGLNGRFGLWRCIVRAWYYVSRAVLVFCEPRGMQETIQCQGAEISGRPDLSALNCRVRPAEQKGDGSVFDALSVEICGSISVSGQVCDTTLRVQVSDITDGLDQAKAVHSRVKEWQMQDSGVFGYHCSLGKLPGGLTTLSDWTAVAELKVDWMKFPRKGKRKLQFSTSIVSGEQTEQLASAVCTFDYENSEPGYVDVQENIQRTRSLAVALAFAVSAANSKLYNCRIEIIKNWARGNVDISKASNKAKRELEKALNKAVAFFRAGNQLDNYKICKEIVELSPVADRYDILELCLRVARANGVAAAAELVLLKNLARWLEVDMNRFRTMMEKILPVSMHEVEDAEVLVGVTSDMSEDQARRCLNKEYRKWNARVTNLDPEIQRQADHMLSFIAEARSACIG